MRSILALWRMSTGNALTFSTAATGCSTIARTASDRSVDARPVGCVGVLEHHDQLLDPDWSDADRCRPCDREPTLDGPLDRHGRHHPADRPDHVHEPAFDPEPAGGVDVADVARAVPPLVRPGPGCVLGRPQVRVAVRHPRRRDQDLTGLPRRERVSDSDDGSTICTAAPRPGVRHRRRRRDRRAWRRRSPPGRCRRSAGPRSSRTGCAARRVAARRATACRVSDGTGAPAENTTRRRSRSGHVRGGVAVAITLASAAGDPKASVASIAPARRIERFGGQLPGLRDIAIGQAGRNAECRAVQRERCERGDEPVVRGDLVGAGERVALLRQLAVQVTDTLRRTGGTGGEQDRRQVVGGRFGAAGRPRCVADIRSSTSIIVARGAHRRVRAASSARRGPITQVGREPRTAAPSPRSPRPRSATTVTPPARHTPYTAATRSMPGGVSIATRSPGRSPRRCRSAATVSIRVANSSNRSTPPVAMSANATLRSPRRSITPAHSPRKSSFATRFRRTGSPTSCRKRGSSVDRSALAARVRWR